MNEIFEKMFTRLPDEIECGDYHYHVPRNRYERDPEWRDYTGRTIGEYAATVKMRTVELFDSTWKHKTLDADTVPFPFESWTYSIAGENRDARLVEMLREIAYDDKPLMDIASSGGMGLAPYFMKLNPRKPCLITDVSSLEMKILRSCLNENLPEYNVHTASFDNNDIPMFDSSIDYITSNYGILSSASFPADGQKKASYHYSEGTETAISEVYRVLKPGGRFVTVEMSREFDFDLYKLCHDSMKNGKLFGIYTYNEIQAVLERLTEESWRDKFTSAGFEVEYEKRHYELYSIDKVMNFLHNVTKYYGIRNWEKRDWYEERRSGSVKWNSADYDADDIGIDIYDTNTIFVLGKSIQK